MKHFDIFRDISGKSVEILDLLGIDQRARFKHVHCPLPEHDDRHPSFRVDQKSERFICTCSPRGGSMIDLVIGMGHASNFVEAARWLRKNLFGYAPQYKQVKIPNDFVTSATDSKDAADRTEILRVLSKCVEVPLLHPYVMKKWILPLCAKYEPILKNLVLPIHDNQYQLQGIEYIDRQENKFCVDGTRKSGNGLMIGNADESPILGVAEGWATAVSIHMALGGLPVLATFGASNLSAVKNFAHDKQDVWFFADNDTSGLDAAKRAAKDFGPNGYVFSSTLSDFNDDYIAIFEGTKFDQLRQAMRHARSEK
jgi:phage/plasmid primase-like uncharacterized protein